METPTPDSQAPRSIVDCFSDIPDPRVERTRAHKLIDILVIGLCSILTGGEGFCDMELFGQARYEWLKTFMELPNGIPSHDTFNRVFSTMDPKCFLECFVRWVEGVCTALGQDVVAIDGKALRHASDSGDSLPYIVSAWARNNGLVLGQVKVDEKSNEITAVPELLRVLELKGCIVTIDAMGCQKAIAADIIDKQADYVLALKANHATAHEEFKEYFDDLVPAGAPLSIDSDQAHMIDSFQTSDKGHGRIEIRHYYQTTDIDWFEDKELWKGLRTAGMVESTRIVNDTQTVERRYYLSSLPLDAEKFGHAVRSHWGVENSPHWTLDVTFGEDQSRARTKHAAENLATLRRVAVNLVKKDKDSKWSIRNRRRLAALDPDYLSRLLDI